MTNEPSPRPWRIADGMQETIVDECNNIVANAANNATAALIVAAVNYYKPDLHCDWRELTPEEAVAHCREVAARLGDTPCARDHQHLAAWIEEREHLREQLAATVSEALAIREERDRLRDIVRKLCDALDTSVCALPFSGLLREARAAIGEDAK